jgi:HlyD family secretion protein
MGSCQKGDKEFDATGSFEAVETLISAEVAGKVVALSVEEGQELKVGQVVGHIDSTMLSLQRKQLELQIASLLSKRPNVSVQLAALESQLTTAQRERERIARLVKEEAIPRKQLDDIEANVDVINEQIHALRSTLHITSNGISNDANSLAVQLDQLDYQLSKCKLVNPVNGTVLTSYVEEHELLAPGKPIYRIADLNDMILRVYVSADQLAQVKLGQAVRVYTDDGEGGFNEAEGRVSWISEQAEFTPKTIQTKNERAHRVYAVKLRVKNSGLYRIGMYAEVRF